MLNALLQTWNNYISYDPDRDPDAIYVRCPCQEKITNQLKNLATYRCQMVSDTDVMSHFPELQDHLHNYYYRGEKERVYQFIGCDLCLKSPLLDRFTHHPLSWKENKNHHIEYEAIKPMKKI